MVHSFDISWFTCLSSIHLPTVHRACVIPTVPHFPPVSNLCPWCRCDTRLWWFRMPMIPWKVSTPAAATVRNVLWKRQCSWQIKKRHNLPLWLTGLHSVVYSRGKARFYSLRNRQFQQQQQKMLVLQLCKQKIGDSYSWTVRFGGGSGMHSEE